MVFAKEVKQYIYDNYLGTGHKAMADMLNYNFNIDVTTKQMKSFYHNHKLNSGLTGRFEKGHAPHNKGKKMPQDMYEKCKNTMFKVGEMPHNHKPVGSERISIDGYAEIKVAEPKKWRMKHVVIWERKNGNVPKGGKVIFADKDKTNFAPENLMLVSREKLLMMNRHGLIKAGAEATKSGAAVADIYMAIHKRKRKRSKIK